MNLKADPLGRPLASRDPEIFDDQIELANQGME
jgi:hypothetical protein